MLKLDKWVEWTLLVHDLMKGMECGLSESMEALLMQVHALERLKKEGNGP